MRKLSLLLVCMATTFFPGKAIARPLRGASPIAVLLCRANDQPAQLHDQEYFTQMLLSRNTGGLADYWFDISYGQGTIDGSAIHGWYTVPLSAKAWGSLGRGPDFDKCLQVAANDKLDPFKPQPGQAVFVITSPTIDIYGDPSNHRSMLGEDYSLGAFQHEGGHGRELNHSFSNDPTFLDAPWANYGEYDDPWDAMAWANSFAVSSPFGAAAPSLIAPHVDRLGWLPKSRIATAGADGQASAIYTLSALEDPMTAGSLMIRVPFDIDDPKHYYTVEFHRPIGWDAGFPVMFNNPAGTVLIHEIKKTNDKSGNFIGRIATLQLDYTKPGRTPKQEVAGNGVDIKVMSIDAATNQARVSITTSFPERCLLGYVWRDAAPGDHVCVTPGRRQQVAEENLQGPSHRSLTGGPYGPDTCKQGYVWRDGFANDHVCVSPDLRTSAAQDNGLSLSRKNPARLTYGPNNCNTNYVWREADDWDYVCVNANRRAAVHQENLDGTAHRSPTGGAYGPDTCNNGFVWREAFANDHVCVLPASRALAVTENTTASGRWQGADH